MTAEHVIPIGDLIDHDTDEDCACGPTAEPVERVDGSVGWLMIHHSLDGREQEESTVDAQFRDCRCQDWDIHEHFTGRPFRWKRPTVHYYRTATRRRAPHLGFNRYPHNTIGIGVAWLGRGLTLNWKGSRR